MLRGDMVSWFLSVCDSYASRLFTLYRTPSLILPKDEAHKLDFATSPNPHPGSHMNSHGTFNSPAIARTGL